MPQNSRSKQILFFLIGMLWGAVLVLIAGVLYLRYNLITEQALPGTFEEITEKIPSAVESAEGWNVTKEQCQLPQSADGQPVAVYKFCNPDYAKELLTDEDSRKIAAALPCGIAFYRKKDGRVYMSKWNMPLIGRLLGGMPAWLFPGRIAEDQSIIMMRISAKKVEKSKRSANLP